MKQWLSIFLYGYCRWSWRVQRGATSLAYWGIFSVACNAARTNSLISYGISVGKYPCGCKRPSPYIFSPRFFGGASSALRIGLASPASSAQPIGTRACRTGNRSGLYARDSCGRSLGCVLQTRLPILGRRSVLPRHCQAGSGCAHTRAKTSMAFDMLAVELRMT